MNEKRSDMCKELDEKKKHYCVIYTHALKQWDATEAIRRALPDGGGEVFYPCVELWWRGSERTRYKALFPGYVFIRSDMSTRKLHEIIRLRRHDILSFVKELHLSEKRMFDSSVFDEMDDESVLLDLNDDEADFFDSLMGFEYDDDYEIRKEIAIRQDLYKPLSPDDLAEYMSEQDYQKALILSEHRRRQRRIPDKGVLQISFGYRDKGRIVVMEGPLLGQEHRIIDYKYKDSKAYLDFRINGHIAKAGLIILGKKAWFPDDKDAKDILSDGTELDTDSLRIQMNSNYFDSEKNYRRKEQRMRDKRK